MATTEKRYTWDHPLDWLTDKINDYENLADLKHMTRELASQLDGDQIQDLFQDEMEADGYFEAEGADGGDDEDR